MTERLYYHDSFLYDFDALVSEVIDSPRPALVLDRTAFYPTSGGQIFDTGWLSSDTNPKLNVTEVADREDGKVIHYLDATPKELKPGSRVRGQIDAARRRDHMQQHSGQHVLSAAFLRLYNLPTVSFHMGEDYCSIDLNAIDLNKGEIVWKQRVAKGGTIGGVQWGMASDGQKVYAATSDLARGACLDERTDRIGGAAGQRNYS